MYVNKDRGSGSLRATIAAAATIGDTIDFSSKLKVQTINLTSGPLTLGVNLTIDGLGANKLTVKGGGTEGVFVVSAGVTATIENLTIANGLAVQGAGIDNFGTLTVSQRTLTGNTAVGGSGDCTTPDAASGGGIANEVGASLALTQSLLTKNVAAATPGTDSFGGALLNLGSATVTNTTFIGNEATGGDGAGGATASRQLNGSSCRSSSIGNRSCRKSTVLIVALRSTADHVVILFVFDRGDRHSLMFVDQAVSIWAASVRPRSSIACSLRMCLRILPVTVRGRWSTIMTYCGTLKYAIWSRQ